MENFDCDLYLSMFRVLNICWIIFLDIMLFGIVISIQFIVGISINKIFVGQQIFIIKIFKGVYIRINLGKIFVVRVKFFLFGSIIVVVLSFFFVILVINLFILLGKLYSIVIIYYLRLVKSIV